MIQSGHYDSLTGKLLVTQKWVSIPRVGQIHPVSKPVGDMTLHRGWFNAARRSSILPENLITCARLYDLYTKRITEGDYIHEAFVALDKALVPAGTPQIRSAPSLIDLIHEENISPPMADEEALEELLFNHPDPFDLAETEHVNFNDPDVPAAARLRDVFAIAEYIKLDSLALEELIHTSKLGISATEIWSLCTPPFIQKRPGLCTRFL
ncbi:hypothetical protein C8J57DRAFT_1247112 [Mycena rebaudengoi]|nr:hypothetical protein C8J57DRAFT_1247112 [Mycena rebaudengoi]